MSFNFGGIFQAPTDTTEAPAATAEPTAAPAPSGISFYGIPLDSASTPTAVAPAPVAPVSQASSGIAPSGWDSFSLMGNAPVETPTTAYTTGIASPPASAPAPSAAPAPAQAQPINASDISSLAQLQDYISQAQAAGKDTSALTKKLADLQQQWGTAGAMHDNVRIDPVVGDKLYSQLDYLHNSIQKSLGKDYWSGEGFGSTAENTKAFANSLARQGITDLSKVAVKEVPVYESASYRQVPTENGGSQWVQVAPGTSGDNAQYIPVNDKDVLQQLNSSPTAREGYATLNNVQTGTRQALVDKNTGKVFEGITGNRDSMYGTMLGNKGANDTFYVGDTYSGNGKTNFQLKAVTDKNGVQHLVPLTTQSDTGDADLVSSALTFASMVPALAPFAAGANALIQADNGNWGGAIMSGIGAIPGLNTALNMGLSPETLGTIKNVGSGLNIANALQKGDLSSLAGGIAGLTGVGNKMIGDTGVSMGQVAQGLTAAQAASKGDWITAALAGTAATGAKTLPGTDVTIPQASSIVGVAKALGSGNPYSVFNAAQKAALTMPKKADGGLISEPPAGTIPPELIRRAMTGIAALGA